jgi:CheY-like chemotaxis protein
MPRSIFIIDDYEDSLELYAEALAGEDLLTFAFREPLSALAALRDIRPSLILLDWHLPHLSGGDFLREVRAHPSLCHIPVIVLTGDGRLTAAKTGAQAVLLKPVELRDIVTLVRTWISASRATDEARI